MNTTCPDLSVIIVSWNVRDLLRACLRSVYDGVRSLRLEVFVVDNASRDGSAEMVAREFPDVRLIANAENKGFGCANNQALRLATGRYALLLNPDTLTPEGAIERLVEFMERRPAAGLVGPELVDGNGRLLVNWARWTPRHLAEMLVESAATLVWGRTRILFTQPRRTPVLNGACWLARREAIAGIGLFDEDFFMYAEEPDVCTRLRDAGWEIWLVRDVVVTHYKKQSVRQRTWGWDLPLFARNMALWLRKRWRKRQAERAWPHWRRHTNQRAAQGR